MNKKKEGRKEGRKEVRKKGRKKEINCTPTLSSSFLPTWGGVNNFALISINVSSVALLC